jgi:cellulose synthase/poly-beta-1,6-N-acetylglucosamine synthase-like glycosyltransferase
MKFAEMIRGATPLENGWQALQPRISVILPTYNRHAEDRLLPCIQSVLAQSFTDFELIIYDDGSMDGSGEVIRSLAVEDPRIVFIPISRNTVSTPLSLLMTIPCIRAPWNNCWPQSKPARRM